MAEEIQKYLEKILSSKEFSNADKYQKLLTYLFEAFKNNEVPKEVTIAYEVFGIDSEDYSSGESNIRVYIHNLRKKLDSYYSNEGINDKLRILIPKGRYKIEFQKQRLLTKVKIRNVLIPVISLFILLAVLNIIFIKRIKNNNSSGHHKVGLLWSPFIESQTPTLMVIGDYYLIDDERDTSRIRYLRDSQVNSDRDLEILLQNRYNKEDSLKYTKHTFLGKYAPFCVNSLAKLFYSYNKPFEIKMASDFTWQDLQKNNVIFVGSYKTLRLFNYYLKKSNFRYVPDPPGIDFKDINTDSILHFDSYDSNIENAYETDYAVVTLLPGVNNNKVLCFVASRDIGLIASTNIFSNQQKLNEFESAYIPDRDNIYFEAIYQVQGLQRNVSNFELVKVNKLDPYILFEETTD